jgi:hypothetical protein
MSERNETDPRDKAQEMFIKAGHEGDVEDFVIYGADDFTWMRMKEKDQTLWNRVVEADENLLKNFPFI